MSSLLNVVKKVFTFWALLVLLSTCTHAQNAIRLDDQFLYNGALRASLERMSQAWDKFDLTARGRRAPIDFHNMVVRKDPVITDELNSQFGEYRVTYLDNRLLINRYKKLRKEFAILIAQPVDCSGDHLQISVHLSWVSYRHARLQIGIDSWANVYFRYDAVKREYVVDNVELGGV